ncbi:exonuclease SbcC [Rhodoferax lacus]|uniref:Exonuclease SbcC n=1 Tax=Rhodoferax lacus TaxID=2184758 RepID=A0A3E1R7A3_9BURK|nr:AAA family ATPase [Rhodoferax lacus]RFO95123.1 exonuclease SbcC [Rhodoferax lacus]
MKILAIRGKNLASLAAEFVVDFEREPLASAGLYAITGTTGSGKSTLLDALCLALYERTPRLAKATAKGESIPDVGEHDVSPSDPRTLLRRGASEGFAEVDFVGNDGVAYRARWSARRARAKSDGKLQASEITLQRIVDGQRLGDHTKTETLRLIEACIGLSFEQFTRAVLLAQNDFATFLKAPDDERAELLQTLTGTETFSAISRQAYARMKTENEVLAQLHSRLKDQLPMEAEARAEKDATLQTQGVAATLLASQKADVEGHQRWFQQQAQHQHALQQASTEHAAAITELQAAAPRHAHLAQLEQVQSARPLWAELQRLTLSAAAATQAQADAAALQAQAQESSLNCQSAFDAAREEARQADAAKAEQQPAIDQARALDASILAVTPQVQAALLAQTEAQAHRDAEAQRQAALAEQSTQTQADLQSTVGWLESHAPLRALQEGWPRWETLFANAQTVLVGQGASQAEARALEFQAAAAQQQLETAHTTLQQATAFANTAEQHLAIQIQACAAGDADALAQDKQSLEEQRDHLQAAALLWQKRSDVRAQRLRLQEQQKAHTNTLADSERTLQECAHSQPLLASAQHSAEQALQLSQLAASKGAETLRTQLQPEQPCPVCGALDHPYTDHNPALNAVLHGLQDHVAQARLALTAVQQQHAVATANQSSATQALVQCARELEQLAAQHAALVQEWTALALQSEVDAIPVNARNAWLQERQDLARKALADLSAQEAAHRRNLQHKDAAQRALNTANTALAQARDAVTRLSSSASQTTQAQDSTQHKLAELAQQLDSTLTQLDAAFADTSWRERWSAAPEAFVAQCQANAQAWAQQQQGQTLLTQRMAELQIQTQAAASACDQATQQLQMQMDRCQTVQTTLQGYQTERASLLQGRAVSVVEASLSSSINQAKSQLNESQTALQTVQAGVTRLNESLRLATLQLAQEHSAHAAAERKLGEWLRDFNNRTQAEPDSPQQGHTLGTDALQTLLAAEPAWITQERQALQALQSAVTKAHAVLETRRQSLAAHEATRATQDSEQALQEQLHQLNTNITTLAETLSALKLDLARDDERLAASGALRGQIALQTAAAKVWSQLGELIGSADGKKFRNFAQQLTLDILLGYGNSHLQALSTRYQLKRIEGSLGLLVVDRDMGDEVRSVHSLSGGESFLVSLAMALGLASLSSHRVRVESLFIDEGFGSLDADSLRIAMDALDNLQSLGRKVGVISHVQEMTERIGTRVQVQRQAGGLSRVVVG